MQGRNLTYIAGKRAFDIIKGEGLKQERVSVLAGAAGGPKWLVLSGIDRILAGTFFNERNKPLSTIGSSIACWRFAAYGQEDPGRAFDEFEERYINQRYGKETAAEDVSRTSRKILEGFIGTGGIENILNHRYIRTNIITVRCRWPVSSEKRSILLSGLGAGYILNLFSRKFLNGLFDRTIFYDGRELPPLGKNFIEKTKCIKLNRDNLSEAIMATASIPLVMTGVPDPPGAPSGIYRDGGITDYHLDIPFQKDRLVLYPHFLSRIIPGWFDKKILWRKPERSNLENVLLISPSPEFIRKLPHEKIPDRNDFITFRGRDEERIEYWEKVISLNRILGEELLEDIISGRIKEKITLT